MAHTQHTPPLERLEEGVTVLLCLIDDAYALINPPPRRYESIKRLSDTEVITLALFQQSFGVWSRSILSCAIAPVFSLSWCTAWSVSAPPPRFTGGYAGSGGSSNP
jgi:hypothetical protein